MSYHIFSKDIFNLFKRHIPDAFSHSSIKKCKITLKNEGKSKIEYCTIYCSLSNNKFLEEERHFIYKFDQEVTDKIWHEMKEFIELPSCVQELKIYIDSDRMIPAFEAKFYPMSSR